MNVTTFRHMRANSIGDRVWFKLNQVLIISHTTFKMTNRTVKITTHDDVLYRNDIYPVQVRIVVEGRFMRGSVSSSVPTEPRSVDSSSGLGLLFGYRRLAVMS